MNSMVHVESQNDKLYNNIDKDPKTCKCRARDVGRGPNIGKLGHTHH